MKLPLIGKSGELVRILVLIGLLVIISPVVLTLFYTTRTIYQLLGENRELKQAITNLTEESQIGYAKVLSQETTDGRLWTRLLFVETDRTDPTQRILEKEYRIEGDVVHFDALIVKFDNRIVMDGKERAIYLWRRIYGEHTKPEDGLPIETEGAEPQRYADIGAKLSLRDRTLFWSEIWDLSNDLDRLKEAGVHAIYGNVNYRRLRPGLIYVFKINPTGGLYSEIVPDL